MNIIKTEPAVVIGLVASILVIVAQQILGSGIVTSAGAVSVLNLVISLVPLLAGALTRSQVTPTASLPTSLPTVPPTPPAGA